MISSAPSELACEDASLLAQISPSLETVQGEQAALDSSTPIFLPLELEEGTAHRPEHRLRPVLRRLLSQTASSWKCHHVTFNGYSWCQLVNICRSIKRPLWCLIWILGFLKILSLMWTGLIYLFPDDLDARLDTWVFPGGQASTFSHWITHTVIPVRCHSHNDYTRPVPLFSAIQAGCISVEADIWLSEGDLLVGHNRFTLHHAATLRSLYLDPLLDMLEKHNTRSSSLQPDRSDGQNLAGVFANDPSQTLVLLIDFKTDGKSTLPYVLEQLTPLRERGYLTHFNGVELVQRPVTVVASGDVPLDCITANSTTRDIFLDAPLEDLWSSVPGPRTEGEDVTNSTSSFIYNYTNSYYASVDFRKTVGSLTRNSFSQQQLARVRTQVAAAHERGLKVRYWGTPTWPRGLRNHVWHVLVREQVDLINVDNLPEATMQDWRKHRSWFL